MHFEHVSVYTEENFVQLRRYKPTSYINSLKEAHLE